MKRLFLILSLAIGTRMLSPTPPADARRAHRSNGGQANHVQQSHRGSRIGVPELDPGTTGSALLLSLGRAAYLISRRREEDVA